MARTPPRARNTTGRFPEYRSRKPAGQKHRLWFISSSSLLVLPLARTSSPMRAFHP
ncbi:hypothetical protein HMPREF0291_11723 [Corynebacterium genitalium ATCC 33030]|uniref:Uncharacterized protein n=1 Tax=Corynebacterium genitalium ATCC 33030 TaxID=585529 RepID=D7WD35_9CORY|nr:hypothetical protein HMPREF0291_11723 [Corynebacterium genitalium ATCC 33030]